MFVLNNGTISKAPGQSPDARGPAAWHRPCKMLLFSCSRKVLRSISS